MEDKIGLASDHAGYEMKEYIRKLLEGKNRSVVDYGTYSAESTNYAIYGHRLAKAVEQKEVRKGIAVCSTGNGINMTVNKHKGIRAALCWNEEIARLARAHNDANILTLPGRFISFELAEKIITAFLDTPFEGGRHQCRVDAIDQI
ncbi:MAG: ribose 5-phosphate isomerase B [Candidatus Azobacteroides sp.]|nr:ribose 5-phosphate isomerase B [Candidatus Azobacteroides sp.]